MPREVPVTQFGANFFSDPDAFANDFVDALDAAVKLSPVLENLSDLLKSTLKQEGARILREKVHGPLSQNTITCEE